MTCRLSSIVPRVSRVRPQRIIGLIVLVLLVAVYMLPAHAQTRTSGAVLEGTVVAATSGEPLEGVRLLIVGGRHQVLTDQGGRYRITGLPPGAVTVTVRRTGYLPVRETLETPAGGTVNRSFELEEEPSLIEEVTVTATRETEEIRDLPMSIGIVSREETQRIRATDPAQVLNRVAGAHIVPFEDMATHNAVRQPLCCRATLLVSEDGVPLSSPSFYRHSVINWVDLVHAERVEVLKGPGTAIYGSDAVSGVINVITVDPPVSPSGDASGELGPYGYRRATVGAGGTFGGHGLRVDAAFARSDGRRENPMERQDISLRWTTALQDRAHFRTSLAFGNVNGIGNDDQTPEEFFSRSTFNPYPIAKNDATVARASTTYRQAAGSTSWSIAPFARWMDTPLIPAFTLATNPVVRETELSSGGVLAQVRHALPKLRTVWTTGIDIDYTAGRRREPRITPVVESDGQGREIWSDFAVDVEEPRYDYRWTYAGSALYTQLDILPTERLRLNAGVRFDRARYSYTNRLPVVTTGSFRRPPDSDRRYSRLTPKLGLTYRLSEQVTLFGAHRHGFRVPLEDQLFKQGASENTLDLEPIDVVSSELGVRARVMQRLQVEATAYRMRLTNDILSFRDPDGQAVATNNGQTLHQGMEVSASAAPVRELQVRLAYSLARHELQHWLAADNLDLSGNEMDVAPRHTWNAELSYAPAVLRGGTLALEWLGMSGYWVDRANTKWQEGYDVFHLRVSAPVTRRIELFGRLINITDRLYATQVFDGFGDIDRFYNPEQPRALYAGMRARF
ncbi:MAG: TonB-dependent receptor plug domain-containing protein [Luteitalea sp.]|nr:TonB-dependent receptor plug domain-containing protein [Luteitalea sp.]